MMDLTLHSAICAAVEAAVNTTLRYDPASRQALGRLQGRVLAVELISYKTRPSPHARFYLRPEADRLRVQSHYEGEVETCLKGSPLALAALLKADRMNLADSGVEVFGSTGLLMELQQIVRQLDIDWEEALSDLVGDVAAHQGAGAVRNLSNWAEGRRTTFERLLGEYLSEELGTTPARPELEHYYRAVDDLRLATDRLIARVDALIQKENTTNH